MRQALSNTHPFSQYHRVRGAILNKFPDVDYTNRGTLKVRKDFEVELPGNGQAVRTAVVHAGSEVSWDDPSVADRVVLSSDGGRVQQLFRREGDRLENHVVSDGRPAGAHVYRPLGEEAVARLESDSGQGASPELVGDLQFLAKVVRAQGESVSTREADQPGVQLTSNYGISGNKEILAYSQVFGDRMNIALQQNRQDGTTVRQLFTTREIGISDRLDGIAASWHDARHGLAGMIAGPSLVLIHQAITLDSNGRLTDSRAAEIDLKSRDGEMLLNLRGAG